ncbi:hypothetical protein FGO68_gene1740 [Halteria grandinella]|uniref:Uncharacterized protein n=1 Tax=Halteria grandinella TaxID=5974 RepID=A0A8J8SW61_HALGN|nr:hypothetical protein FGO68_gene1740 [Halteria grandinella]
MQRPLWAHQIFQLGFDTNSFFLQKFFVYQNLYHLVLRLHFSNLSIWMLPGAQILSFLLSMSLLMHINSSDFNLGQRIWLPEYQDSALPLSAFF